MEFNLLNQKLRDAQIDIARQREEAMKQALTARGYDYNDKEFLKTRVSIAHNYDGTKDLKVDGIIIFSWTEEIKLNTDNLNPPKKQ